MSELDSERARRAIDRHEGHARAIVVGISRTATDRPIATTMVFTAIIIVGLYAFSTLQIDLFPSVDLPRINIITQYQGVAPEEIENLITLPIERAVSRVDRIQRIESSSIEGRSVISLRFDWGLSLDEAVNEVRSAIDQVRDLLPEDAGEPIIFKFDLADFPVMDLALAAPGMDEVQAFRFAEDVARPRIERSMGVADIETRGAREREIRVELDPERLAATGIGIDEVLERLRASSSTTPAGLVRTSRENILIRTMSEYEAVGDIGDVVLRHTDSGDVRVSDVAQLVDGFEDRINIIRVNGDEGIQLRVRKRPEANTVEVADALEETIAAFNREYEGRASLTVILDSSSLIRDSIRASARSVALGGLLAIVVLLLFLRSVRAMLVIAISIPIAGIATFFIMAQLDLTLNLISFGGLAVGLGMLVDNAIVILENIYRERQDGASIEDATLRGAEDVASAITASTMTTLVVFAPVLFLGGFAAIFFGQMALVVTAALLCSLATALTLVPVMARRLLAGVDLAKPQPRPILSRIEHVYMRLLRWSSRRPLIVIIPAIALTLGAVLALGEVGTELLPEADEGEVRISGDYPPGTRLEVTNEMSLLLEARARELIPEGQRIVTRVGNPRLGSTSGEESLDIRIDIGSSNTRERSAAEIAREVGSILSDEVTGLQLRVRPRGGIWIFNFIRGGDDRLRVEIRGYDTEVAAELAEEVMEVMAGVDGVTSVRSNERFGGEELRLAVNREAAADVGLSAYDVAQQISVLVQGARVGVYRDASEEYDVRVRLSEQGLSRRSAVLESPVLLPGGGTLPLAELILPGSGQTLLEIKRIDQERVTEIGAESTGRRSVGELNAELRERLAEIQRPDDFSILVTGEAEEQERTFSQLQLGILLALMLVFMTMAAQFESLLHPLVILFSVPFALVGVVPALWLFESTLNVNSLLGLLLLVGIVGNNSIVLVDCINQLRRRDGLSVDEAILRGAHRRLRPILMTTTTTLLALTPIALMTGPGSENQAPLAQVMVGGLLSSTLISLILIPVIYRLAEQSRARCVSWVERFRWRRSTS